MENNRAALGYPRVPRTQLNTSDTDHYTKPWKARDTRVRSCLEHARYLVWHNDAAFKELDETTIKPLEDLASELAALQPGARNVLQFSILSLFQCFDPDTFESILELLNRNIPQLRVLELETNLDYNY
ncbi:hypothetical protein EC957_011758 [Mortierella hygrophila]|uniref:Uncharacterized protein n=1 Tax=Mortierella hygrophila TaxID=979708 RepID=A0A9P6K350_9FUNG|nr:hypothetical protein EC957_011758 [Mortierella hygrophila]